MYIPIDSQAYFRAEIDDVCNPDNKDFVWQFDFDSDSSWDYDTLTYWLDCIPPPWTYETKGWYHPKVKVGLEGVPDSDAEDTCIIAVVTVNNVVWQTYGDNTPLAGGKIFPGKKTYEDEHGPDRRKVKVKATLNIAPDASDNIYVHFKRWDVDDPCFSTAPLDPDDSDPDPNKHSIDNRGSFKFENNDHSIDVLAEGCVVYATFLVSMNPGDNYRITATTSQEANDDLTHYKVETGNIPSSVKRTPILTTWRKLWQSIIIFLLITCSSQTAHARSVYVITDSASTIKAYDIQGDQIEEQATAENLADHGGAVGLALDPGSEMLFVTYEGSEIIEMLNAKTMISEKNLVKVYV